MTLNRKMISKLCMWRLNALVLYLVCLFVCFWWDSPPQWVMASSFTRFLDLSRHTTVSRVPLDAWSARRRNLYLTSHNTRDRHTSMPPVGFEPTISAGERPQNYALDRVATGTGLYVCYTLLKRTQLTCRACVESCNTRNDGRGETYRSRKKFLFTAWPSFHLLPFVRWFVYHKTEVKFTCSSNYIEHYQWRTEGGGTWSFQTPPPRNSEGPPKSCQTQPDCENC